MNLNVAPQRLNASSATLRQFRVSAVAAASAPVSTPPSLPQIGGSRGNRPQHRQRGGQHAVPYFNREAAFTTKSWPPPSLSDSPFANTSGSTNSSTSTTGSGLPPIAVHFLVVGVLFFVVVILALVNAYLHFRSQRRRLAHRRTYVATPEERFASQRRRRSRRGGRPMMTEDEQSSTGQRRSGLSVRMKSTKMFTA